MLFNILADAAEENAELSAAAIDVARRTHAGILDAVGVSSMLPSSVRNIADSAFDASQSIVRGAGQTSATALRNIGQSFESGSGEEDSPDEQTQSIEGNDEGGAEQDGGAVNKGPFPDRPDSRDHPFDFVPEHPLGHLVDLRASCPAVYNQKHMMSCTAHAVAGAFEFDVMKQGLPPFTPSRLFIWYNARAKSDIPKAVLKNVGSSLRIAIQSLDFKALGVCAESEWSYEEGEYNKKTLFFINNAKAAKNPPTIVKDHAHLHTAARYFSFKPTHDLLKQLIQCLDRGYPFVFGMKTYGLLSNVDGSGRGFRMPTTKETKGDEHRHSLLAVGYIQAEKVFIVRNSWGADWGQHGYFYMPYDFLKHCYDFWTIRVVNSKHPAAPQHSGRK